MRTVKEISNVTGISVRTLHYYDEIGLLKPTDKSEAGYRLYNDRALERLQQIMFHLANKNRPFSPAVTSWVVLLFCSF